MFLFWMLLYYSLFYTSYYVHGRYITDLFTNLVCYTSITRSAALSTCYPFVLFFLFLGQVLHFRSSVPSTWLWVVRNYGDFPWICDPQLTTWWYVLYIHCCQFYANLLFLYALDSFILNYSLHQKKHQQTITMDPSYEGSF